jgi:hypothetical protein
MRQVGILCAAALVALHETVLKLEDDHKKTKMLAGTWCPYLCNLALSFLRSIIQSHPLFAPCRKSTDNLYLL